MLDERHNKSCPRENEIVSYLYREMSPVEVDRFEDHLAECGKCVDEFAAMSEPHLAVYEWRTNVFDKIPAPSIELPIVEEQHPHAESLLGRLIAVLSGWPAGLRVSVGFAALLVVGFAVFLLTRPSSSSDVARNVETLPVQTRKPVTNSTLPSEEFSVVESEGEGGGNVDKSSVPSQKAVHIKSRTKMPAKAAAVRTGRSEFAANRKEKSAARPSLRLNNFEDDEDTTLRLADLFEEVGSL